MTRADRIEKGPATQKAYEDLVDEVADLRRRKVLAYGESRYEDTDRHHAFTLLYADIHRKYLRVKQAILSGEEGGVENLRDTFADMANYALMGMQLLDIFKQEPDVRIGLPKVDQVALCTRYPARAKQVLQVLFGSPEWVEDVVDADGYPGENKARLSFNYGIMKDRLEFEVLQYVSGENWMESVDLPAVSHLGVHVDTEEALENAREALSSLGFQVVQDVTTVSHENPAVSGRHYRYTIFGTREVLGFDIKIILRVPE